MIEKIPTNNDNKEGLNKVEEKQRAVGDALLRGNAKKKRMVRGMINYAGILIGVFIIFVVIVALTTKLKVAEGDEFGLKELGINFFVLLFSSYAIYISNADSGSRAGYISDNYTSERARFDELKTTIIERKIQARMAQFCHEFAVEELKITRSTILANVGLKYEEYEERYMSEDAAEIDVTDELSEAQKRAIKIANSIEMINLTPDMILKRGRGTISRAPLGTTPEHRKTRKFITKFLNSAVISLLMSMIVPEVVQSPTWITFVSIALRIFLVVLNGFFGYKFGYENIAEHTAAYMRDQSDLMAQFLQWIEKNPEEEGAEEASARPAK